MINNHVTFIHKFLWHKYKMFTITRTLELQKLLFLKQRQYRSLLRAGNQQLLPNLQQTLINDK